MTARPSKRPRESVTGWMPQGQLAKLFRVGDRSLAIMTTALAGEPWKVLAIETATGNNVAEVLEDHAHAVVGEYSRLPDALEAGDAYGAKWAKGAIAKLEACACEELAAPSA